MNEKETAFLLGLTRDALIECIEKGATLPVSKKNASLAADKVNGEYMISDEQLDAFIALYEAEKPGRYPRTAIRRELLTEANHRCGICRMPVTRLQFHHILEWEKIKHHDPKFMIAVCGTCHDDCGIGKIDKKSQEIYKTRLLNPHYAPSEEDVNIKRARDLEQLNVLFSTITRTVVAKFLYEASAQYMHRAFSEFFWERFTQVLYDPSFHLYDTCADMLIKSFAMPVQIMDGIAQDWGHPTGPGDKLTFNDIHNLGKLDFHNDLETFTERFRDADAAYRKMYAYLRDNYLEIDFDATDARAWEAYQEYLRDE